MQENMQEKVPDHTCPIKLASIQKQSRTDGVSLIERVHDLHFNAVLLGDTGGIARLRQEHRMYTGTHISAEVMAHLPRRTFATCVARYRGERYAKSFTCREQFLAMAFGQLAYRESLRDIVACLAAHREKLYHLGFRGVVARQTLAHANELRDWRIWRDLALALIENARAQYFDEPALADDIVGSCYAIDSTSIELRLSLFRWAPYVTTKGAVKAALGTRYSWLHSCVF